MYNDALNGKVQFDVAAAAILKFNAFQSSTYLDKDASRAVDDNVNTEACTAPNRSTEPWWAVDLNAPMDVARVSVTSVSVTGTNGHNGEHG